MTFVHQIYQFSSFSLVRVLQSILVQHQLSCSSYEEVSKLGCHLRSLLLQSFVFLGWQYCSSFLLGSFLSAFTASWFPWCEPYLADTRICKDLASHFLLELRMATQGRNRWLYLRQYTFSCGWSQMRFIEQSSLALWSDFPFLEICQLYVVAMQGIILPFPAFSFPSSETAYSAGSYF